MTPEANTTPAPTQDQDRRGRFKPGNSLGRRPKNRRRAEQLKAILAKRLTPATMDELVLELLARARVRGPDGTAALKLIFEYVLGAPERVHATEAEKRAQAEIAAVLRAEIEAKPERQPVEEIT